MTEKKKREATGWEKTLSRHIDKIKDRYPKCAKKS